MENRGIAEMVRRRFVAWGLAVLGVASIVLVKSCGFSARIDVIQSFYDRSEFVSAVRCGEDQSTVDIIYLVLNGQGKLMGKNDPLFAQVANPIAVETPDPFSVEGQAATVDATLGGNVFVEVTRTTKEGTRAAGVALLMDNSQSLDGRDEQTGNRIPLTDPNDDRIAGARNFVNNDLEAYKSDRMTLISFHGEGVGGVYPKLRRTSGEAPSSSWFTANTGVLSAKLGELTTEENGKTPLYDAIVLGAQALRTLPSSLRPVMVLFSDGPDNSSNPATLEDARAALQGNPDIPAFIIGLGTLLTAAGEPELKDLACSTNPRGVYIKVPLARDLSKRFGQMQHLIGGYWRATLNLSLPAGLPSGTHTVRGKMFASPQNSPAQCGAGDPCPAGMTCDTGRARCYLEITFPLTVP
jgi:hypothetical protein